MDTTNPHFLPSYNGSKDFSQENVHTANATGFGAPADDYAERGIDLNEQLIRNKAATFFMRVNSDAMIGAGIHNSDVVIVARSLEPANVKVIIAAVDGELLIRRLKIAGGKTRPVPATRKLAAIDVTDAAFVVWGVATYVIHNL